MRRLELKVQLWQGITICLLTLAVGVFVLLRSDKKSSVPIGDGLRLSVAGVAYGATNKFAVGNMLEKALGNMLPPRGINLRWFQLKPPYQHSHRGSMDYPILTVMFELSGSNISDCELVKPGWAQNARLVYLEEDGFEYDAVPFIGGFKRVRDRYIAFCTTSAFPRGGRYCRARLETTKDARWREMTTVQWNTIAEFRVKVPSTSSRNDWTQGPISTPHESEAVGLAVGDVSYSLNNVWEPFRNGIATFNLQVLNQAGTARHWQPQEVFLFDVDGNYVRCRQQSVDGDSYEFTSRGILHTGKLWKIQAGLARNNGFASNELHQVSIPFPLTTLVRTNLGGNWVRIELEGSELKIALEEKLADRRLSVLKLVDDRGMEVGQEAGWTRYGSFLAPNPLVKNSTNIQVRLAIHTNLIYEFLVRPTLK